MTAIAAVAVLGACAESEAPSNKAGETTVLASTALESDDLSGFGSYLAGRFAYSQHDIAAAAQYMTRALNIDPADRTLLQRTVTLLVADGRIDEALKLAPRLIEADPTARIAHLLLVIDDVRQNRLDAATARIKGIPRDGVYVLLVPSIEAWIELARDKVDDAYIALKPLGERDAYAGFYNFQAALIADAADRSAEAETHYKKAITIVPGGTLRTVEAYGAFLERAGRPDEAKAIYDGYLAENKESVWLETVLARLARGEKPKRAIDRPIKGIAEALFDAASAVPQEAGSDAGLLYARLALELRPDFEVARMLVGETLEALNRPDDALAMYRSVSPDSAFSWTAKLRAAANLAELDRVDEAVAELKAAVAARPDRADAAITLGDVLRQAERYAEASEAYDQALARIKTVERRHWSLYYARGITFERTKKWSRAEADFLKALELEPDQPLVLNYLGYSWVEQQINLDRALDMIERAVELRPNDPYIIDSHGWALYQLGDFEGAVRNLEKAVELLSNDPIINDHLGDAYWRADRKNEARFQWERSLALKPEDELAAKVRLKLSRGLTADAASAASGGSKTD